MLEIGKKIGERYKIIRHIGTGGMANVYLGHDLILDRDVAVKVLRYDFQNNKEALRRFQREALSATQLVHPNIVGVYDVDQDNGLQYIIMEYVEGTDLKKYIEESGKASPEEAIHIMSQVLSAMALAHRNRIIHRDIKPQNLLIDRDNTIKVTDFGIAVALSDTSITQTNTLLGSVHYISPEQARGSITTIKSDIYALGIVLYELLNGKVPFDGESAVSIALKHFQEPMPSVRDQDPEIPQSLENVILKATAKEPIDRYESCEEMLHDLESTLSPSRAHESIFTPAAMLDETKVLEPIKVPYDTQNEAKKSDVESDSKKDTDRISKKEKKSKKGKWILAILLLAIVAIAVTFFTWMNREPEPVEIPPISNVNENTARSLLEDANLKLGEVFEEYNEEVNEGFVIRTDPEAGELLPPMSEVDLYISLGNEPIVFSDYFGEDYLDARDELRDLGFIVAQTEIFDDSNPEGVVLEQSIEAGEEVVPKGTTVTLTVSKGSEIFTMDNLEGFNKEGVETYAESMGLVVNFTEEPSTDIAKGLVISQSLPPLSGFTRGESIEVTISSGPAEPEVVTFLKEITIPFKTPENESSSEESSSSESAGSESSPSTSQPARNHVVIYMKDADHSIDEVFREFDITEDQKVTLNFRIIGEETGSYIVERDGEVIMEEDNLTK